MVKKKILSVSVSLNKSTKKFILTNKRFYPMSVIALLNDKSHLEQFESGQKTVILLKNIH